MESTGLYRSDAADISLAKEARGAFLRLQGDERLVGLVRRGNEHAFEALVSRYRVRLLAFCKHMVGTREDAEDVLQEVFAAAYKAMRADTREINVRPWLYRIARNRSLNHLRRPRTAGLDSMDIFEIAGGTTTADQVAAKIEFAQLVEDMGALPETQRSALLMREMGSLSYEQIADAMETTVPGIKSLLVRARVGLAELAAARVLTCAEVRIELAEAAEGLQRVGAPARRHLADCDRCMVFKRELRRNQTKIAALAPVGLVLGFKNLVLAKVFGGAAGTTGGAAIGGSVATGASIGAGGALSSSVSAGIGAISVKAVAGVATAAVVAAGAAEVRHVAHAPAPAAIQVAAPPVITKAPPAVKAVAPTKAAPTSRRRERAARDSKPAVTPVAVTAPAVAENPPTGQAPAPAVTVDEGGSTVELTDQTVQEPPAAETPRQTGPVEVPAETPSAATPTAGTGPTSPAGPTGATGTTGTTADPGDAGSTTGDGATSASGATGETIASTGDPAAE